MGRMILCVLLVVIIILGSALAEDYYILCRPGSQVNIRKRPASGSPVVGSVEFGRVVHADGPEKNGYVHITDLAAEITEGWISAGYLVEEEPRIEKYKAEVWGGPVVARSRIGGKAIKTLRDGKTVTVYAKTNRWAVTNRGYIMCDWLRPVEED